MKLDFFLTAICFSVLGYGLCYITLSCTNKFQKVNINLEKSMRPLPVDLPSTGYEPVRIKKYKPSIMSRQPLR